MTLPTFSRSKTIAHHSRFPQTQLEDQDMPAVTFPRLQDYDISPVTGFLPEAPPLQRLPNPYFEPWESAVQDLNGLLLAGRLRERIDMVRLLFLFLFLCVCVCVCVHACIRIRIIRVHI